MRITRKSFNF